MNEDIKGLKCNCPIELTPMEKWIKEQSKQGNCKPCMLGPLGNWYVSELKERGQENKAVELALVVDTGGTPEDLCKALDKVKTEVSEDLRERLKEFDCEVQVLDSDGKINAKSL